MEEDRFTSDTQILQRNPVPEGIETMTASQRDPEVRFHGMAGFPNPATHPQGHPGPVTVSFGALIHNVVILIA